MKKMQIIVAPDERLNQMSLEVDGINKDIIVTLDRMLDCMYENNGIGLAAPQIGLLKRLIVIDCSSDEKNKRPKKFINPKIVRISNNLTSFEEGCLSLPYQYASVERPDQILLEYMDFKGEKQKKKFTGLEATCIQHEVDHLNGKLFVDHISKLRKNLILKKLIKYKKKGKKKTNE